jgi:hypothetical protein
MASDDQNRAQACDPVHIQIDRPIYTNHLLENEFSINSPINSQPSSAFFSIGTIKKVISIFNPINILKLFTIINMISEYNFKKYLISDIVSGFTTGVMHIPAGIAYGALTSLNPVNGLYTILYPGLVYSIFGTSKHMSVGTFSVLSIMIYSSITKLETKFIDQQIDILNNFNSTEQVIELSEDESYEIKLKIATALAFWCGILQVKIFNLSIYTFKKFI